MFNQHAKWLKVTKIPWRRPIASLNYFLTSHVWRQDHNGFSHQDPGFINHVANKKADIVRIYLPPDGNTLLAVANHCLRSRNYVNVIAAGKQPALQYLSIDEAIKHCAKGIGVWKWASNDLSSSPDAVLGGVDAFILSGGIGENAPLIRSRFLKKLSWLNIFVDEQENEHSTSLNFGEIKRISTKASNIQAFVVKTDENMAIAREIALRFSALLE